MYPPAITDFTQLEPNEAQLAMHTKIITPLSALTINQHFEREFDLHKHRYEACAEAFKISLEDLYELAMLGGNFIATSGSDVAGYYGLTAAIALQEVSLRFHRAEKILATSEAKKYEFYHETNDLAEIIHLLTTSPPEFFEASDADGLAAGELRAFFTTTLHANKAAFELNFVPYKNIDGVNFTGLNVLKLHGAVAQFVQRNDPDLYAQINTAIAVMFPETLHDHLHNFFPLRTVPYNDRVVARHQNFENDARMIRYTDQMQYFKPENGSSSHFNRLAIGEGLMQGINAAIFNETETMASTRVEVAKATVSFFEATKALQQCHQNGAQHANYAYIADHYNILGFWMLWHIYREGSPQQAIYNKAFKAAAYHPKKTGVDAILRPRTARHLRLYDCAASGQLALLGWDISRHYQHGAYDPKIKIQGATIPVALAVQHMREQPHLGLNIAAPLVQALLP